MKINLLWAAAAAILMAVSCEKELKEPDDPVKPVILGDGPVLSGKVTDEAGNPVADAIVSDGFVHSRTGADGSFKFESPYPERVSAVSVCIPSGYAPLIVDGRPVFYRSVEQYSGKERRGNIVLRKLDTPHSSFTLLMTADPQIKPYDSGKASENFAYSSRDVAQDLFEDLRTTASSVSGPCFGICLGDIANNNASVYPQYCLGLTSIGIPFFNVIGNHDHIYYGCDTDDRSAATFEGVFGPRNCSFNIGEFHFILMDNCIYRKDSFSYPFLYGVEDEFLQWLKEDLSYVAKDTPVMLCMHADIINEKGAITGEKYFNTEKFAEAIKGFDKLYVWTGHVHKGYSIGQMPSGTNLEGVECHVLSRSTGILESNEYLCSDGNPRGYLFIEASGKELKWKFHATSANTAPFRGAAKPKFVWKDTSMDKDCQMSVYPRGAYGDDFVYANIFCWDNRWQKPVLTIAGKSYEMAQDYAYDLAYKELVSYYWKQGVDRSNMDNYAGTYHHHHFLVRVPDGAAGTGTVEVTDRFGNKYSKEVSVDPIKSDDADVMRLSFDFRNAPSGCPSTQTSGITMTCSGYTFTLSCGLHSAGTSGEGYVQQSGKGSTLTLPALWGYKLESITVHPSGNAMTRRCARIVDQTGNEVTGGAKIGFIGDCADSWTLEKTSEHTAYSIMAEDGDFRIGSLYLTYRKIASVGYPGDTDPYIIDNPSDIEF